MPDSPFRSSSTSSAEPQHDFDPGLTDFDAVDELISESPAEVYADASAAGSVAAAGGLAVPSTRRRGKGMGLGFWLATGWLGVVAFVAVFVNFLPFEDPLKTGLGIPGESPSLAHPMSVDELGRDILSRVAHGARV